MSTRLEDVIASGDIGGIQTALIAYITANPLDKSEEIKSVLRQIEERGIQIWDKHNDRELILDDSSQWTKDYFATLQSQLITNFSKERFELILKVGKEAYKEELNRPLPNSGPRPSTNSYNNQNRGGTNNTGKLIVAGVVIVALAVTVYILSKN